MAPLPHALGIHTKSPLVERDRAVLRRFKDLSVTFTIVTGDERAARCLEPGAPTVGARIRALDNLARCGIATAVFIGPTIPFVTDRGIEELIGRLARAGVREVILDDLHYLPRIRARLLPALKAYDTGIASRSMQIPENYYQQTGQFILECCRNQGIQCSKLF
jgi:DNA repair photolyase